MSMTRLPRFEKDFGSVDMAVFYQLNKAYEKINIEKSVQTDSILLNIHYQKKSPFIHFTLPSELNQLIHEYLIYEIEIKIKIKYSPSYPFSPPIWFLQGVQHNLVTEVCLLDYYSYKVNQHNQSYTTYITLGNHLNFTENAWTPAITVEKDILSFVQKINHFDEVLLCV
jgi:ubiquitin-protein ligase